MRPGELQGRGRRVADHGFALVLLLVVIAIISGAAANALVVSGQQQRRAAEEELLAIGDEYQRALRSYMAVGQTTRGAASLPRQLEDLLIDNRGTVPVRHLRKVYADPLTGSSDWGLVRDPSGGIAGVHSLSTLVPLKRTGFRIEWFRFKEAKSYKDWTFTVQR
jgi:type II secretory pathway pseudopilin PulG